MQRPNILILMCDQLNASVLGCYGGAVETPNISRLAEGGAIFTSAICPTPICSPTRASMITGVYPHTHGIVHNVNARDYPAIEVLPTEQGITNPDPTTEKILRAAGYRTHHYGKWHLLDEDLEYYDDMFTEHAAYADRMRGHFDAVRRRPRGEWMGWYGWALPVRRSEKYLKALEAVGNRWAGHQYADFIEKIGRLELPVEETFDAMVADRTISAIRTARDSPFMITCSFNAPHDPNVVPSPYYEMFDPDKIELPPNFTSCEERFDSQWSRRVVCDLGEPGLREFMRVCYASVKLIDDQVGRVLCALENSDKAARTLVLFTADHGDMCGGHGMVWKSTDAFYEELVRVPLIAHWAGEVASRRIDAPVNIVDVMPTLLDLAGETVPAGIEGVSLADLLRGEDRSVEQRDFTFCERLDPEASHRRIPRGAGEGSAMIRGRRWEYARYGDGEEVLFDLQCDPGETRNLAADRRFTPTKRRLTEELDTWVAARPG
jgi:arylsulfatase A-like enzyme